MKKYVVFREDRYVQEVLIEAESPEAARCLVARGGGDDLEVPVFVDTIAHEEWEVKESE